jgi:hypothetical protein
VVKSKTKISKKGVDTLSAFHLALMLPSRINRRGETTSLHL